jgi:hypothetical protein
MPVILATQETEIKKISEASSRENSLQDPISQLLKTKKGLVEWLKW